MTDNDPGIPENVRLTLSMNDSPVLDASLIRVAQTARINNGVLMPFTYRDLQDPEDPHAVRPLRYACIMVLETGRETAEDWIKAGGHLIDVLGLVQMGNAASMADQEDLESSHEHQAGVVCTACSPGQVKL